MIVLFTDCMDTQDKELMTSLFADIARLLEEENRELEPCPAAATSARDDHAPAKRSDPCHSRPVA